MITSHPDAPEGEVLHSTSYDVSLFRPPCAILCRNTAPLVAFAYSLLRRDIPCRVLGREIGAQLISIVEKCRAVSLDDLAPRLAAWQSREVSRCEADGRSPERVYDQYDCIVFLLGTLDHDSQSPRDLCAKIELLFEDPKDPEAAPKVLLSTVHKAKGLEWPTVFILDFTKYMPSRFATLPWQKDQERNLIYVAITRAKERLIYIASGCWKESK